MLGDERFRRVGIVCGSCMDAAEIAIDTSRATDDTLCHLCGKPMEDAKAQAMKDGLPYSTGHDQYTETSISIKTVGDLRRLLEGVGDEVECHWFDGNTVFDMEGDHKIQACCEHSGYQHEVRGIIFQIEG